MSHVTPNRLATRNADLQPGQPAGPRLRELETVIKRAQKGFVEAGNALWEIREKRLYRERGYSSFDHYVQGHWDMAKPQAHRLIVAAQTVEKVVSIDTTSVPANVAQARELAKADEPSEVWAEVVDQHEPQEITAAVIREHVEARRSPASDAPPVVIPLTEVTRAVRAAVRAGATTNELYAAYQAGFH